MKLLHLADLHLGKRYNELSLIDDQQHVLNQILNIVGQEKPDCVLIAGDVYDKAVPSAEAVELFDGFLNSVVRSGVKVFMVSGNHDSPERLSFGAGLMSGSGVYISPVYSGNVAPVTLEDEYGKVNFYLLPFIKPATVRRFFEGEQIDTYTQAVAAAVKAMNVDETERNVIVAHQFVTGSTQSGSEEFSVGDVGNVDADVFVPFDYAALGHIHGAQNVGGERVRYCGTPLKYSLSEANNQKSVTIAELKGKGSLSVRTIPLVPLHDVVEIKGAYEEITKKSFYDGTALKESFVHAVLTDEEEVPDVFAKLRIIYLYLMSVKYDNTRTRASVDTELVADVKSRTPIELFSDFFERQNNKPLTDEQRQTVRDIIEKLWGEER
ncbi:MAG: exonuclease SbcCD subunit D [Clostridia bacterium]|nr:exonuclease SbcCD subunit D [Clostridia bacterium]